jgi:hypothetical protein
VIVYLSVPVLSYLDDEDCGENNLVSVKLYAKESIDKSM